jgi:hypothetical protein
VTRGAVNLSDLPPSVQAKLAKDKGIKKPRESAFSKEDVRRYALEVLNVIRHLKVDQRRRVLDHARKVNEV